MLFPARCSHGYSLTSSINMRGRSLNKLEFRRRISECGLDRVERLAGRHHLLRGTSSWRREPPPQIFRRIDQREAIRDSILFGQLRNDMFEAVVRSSYARERTAQDENCLGAHGE